jgi:large subunit ribosomal protein L39e
MATGKPHARKIRMLKKGSSNRRVPAWVMQRTNRRFTRHPKRRSWRQTRIKT